MGPSSRSILIKSHQLLEKTPCVRDALALLRIWGNQRGYGSGSYTTPSSASEFSIHRGKYCVRGFEDLGAWWICLLNVLIFGEEPSAYLTKKKSRPPFGAGLSSYQLFRGVLDFLGISQYCKVIFNSNEFHSKTGLGARASIHARCRDRLNGK